MTKKFGIKKVSLFFSSAFIFIIHIPFVFAKSKPLGKLLFSSNVAPAVVPDTAFVNPDSSAGIRFSLYDSLRLGSLGLGRHVFDYAIKGLNFMKEMGAIGNDQIISIVDFQ